MQTKPSACYRPDLARIRWLCSVDSGQNTSLLLLSVAIPSSHSMWWLATAGCLPLSISLSSTIPPSSFTAGNGRSFPAPIFGRFLSLPPFSSLHRCTIIHLIGERQAAALYLLTSQCQHLCALRLQCRLHWPVF